MFEVRYWLRDDKFEIVILLRIIKNWKLKLCLNIFNVILFVGGEFWEVIYSKINYGNKWINVINIDIVWEAIKYIVLL